MIFEKYAVNVIWRHRKLSTFVINIRQNLKSARLIAACRRTSSLQEADSGQHNVDIYMRRKIKVDLSILLNCYYIDGAIQ
jgi:hypothetical protein